MSFLDSSKEFIIRLFCAVSIIIFSVSCKTSSQNKNPEFVSIEGKTFKLKGNDFYPMVLNYGVDLVVGNNTMWVSPMNTGFKNADTRLHSKEADLLRFKANMQITADLGFNAVRLYHIGEYRIKDDKITK